MRHLSQKMSEALSRKEIGRARLVACTPKSGSQYKHALRPKQHCLPLEGVLLANAQNNSRPLIGHPSSSTGIINTRHTAPGTRHLAHGTRHWHNYMRGYELCWTDGQHVSSLHISNKYYRLLLSCATRLEGPELMSDAFTAMLTSNINPSYHSAYSARKFTAELYLLLSS